MKHRFTSRPTPAVSAVTAVLGLFVVLFFSSLFFSTGPGVKGGPETLFILVWLAAGIGMVIYHLINATRPKGLPTEIIEADTADSKTTAERLQELEDLRGRDLISDVEYQSKRQQILKIL